MHHCYLKVQNTISIKNYLSMKTLIISCLNSGKIHNWIIPQRAQGFINNYYAQSRSLKIGLNLSEELFFKNFDALYDACKIYKKNRIKIIFCSKLQLLDIKNKKKFINFFKKFEIHFALEMEFGQGEKFLQNVFLLNNKFASKKQINLNKFNNYNQIYQYYKKDLLIK